MMREQVFGLEDMLGVEFYKGKDHSKDGKDGKDGHECLLHDRVVHRH